MQGSSSELKRDPSPVCGADKRSGPKPIDTCGSHLAAPGHSVAGISLTHLKLICSLHPNLNFLAYKTTSSYQQKSLSSPMVSGGAVSSNSLEGGSHTSLQLHFIPLTPLCLSLAPSGCQNYLNRQFVTTQLCGGMPAVSYPVMELTR